VKASHNSLQTREYQNQGIRASWKYLDGMSHGLFLCLMFDVLLLKHAPVLYLKRCVFFNYFSA